MAAIRLFPFLTLLLLSLRLSAVEWYAEPEKPNGACMILVSYNDNVGTGLVDEWSKVFSSAGIQCVKFVYRKEKTALEEAVAAVCLVRSQTVERGLNPERIGVAGVFAGARIALLLSADSHAQGHVNWVIAKDPAPLVSRRNKGVLDDAFKFEGRTCPVFLDCSGKNSPARNGVVLLYGQLRRLGVPAELHYRPETTQPSYSADRAVEFLTQMGFLGPLEPEEAVLDRFASDGGFSKRIRERLWPEGRIPSFQDNQAEAFMEWFFPESKKSDAVQIIYSGGAYNGCNPGSFEVVPVRRRLNEMGVTVVVLRYRTPRPAKPLEKYTCAWQDLQRAVRLVRSHASEYGLNADKVGIMGSSAGGHLTLMGVTSSMRNAYAPVDETDALPCNVQWGVAVYPAYVLSDGVNGYNTGCGNDESAVLVPEFGFDSKTVPILFLHGDADGYSAMGSVKAWEKLDSMHIKSELHTLATRKHCFQQTASPGTGSYNWVDRIWEFVQPYVFSLN